MRIVLIFHVIENGEVVSFSSKENLHHFEEEELCIDYDQLSSRVPLEDLPIFISVNSERS